MVAAPQVSVLIPAYNAALYIGEAIESVLGQTFKDFELIIIDNASTDDTAQVVEKYLFDTRIFYIRNDSNIGMGGNWNKCLLYATGKYIKFLMADDVFYPELLEKFVRTFELFPSAVIVTSCRKIFGSENLLIPPPFEGLQPGLKAIEHSVLHNNWIGEPTTVMFKKSSLWVGAFNIHLDYIIDWDMWLRILKTGDIYIIPEYLSAFRKHESQATFKVKESYKDIFEEYNYMNYLVDFNFGSFVSSKAFQAKKKALALKCVNLIYVFFKNNNKDLAKKAYQIGLGEGVLGRGLLKKVLSKIYID